MQPLAFLLPPSESPTHPDSVSRSSEGRLVPEGWGAVGNLVRALPRGCSLSGAGHSRQKLHLGLVRAIKAYWCPQDPDAQPRKKPSR